MVDLLRKRPNLISGRISDEDEYTAFRARVKQWLAYVRWYHTKAWLPDVSLQSLFNAPVVNRKWQIETTDSQLVRFG